jgi:hypothetical protein
VPAVVTEPAVGSAPGVAASGDEEVFTWSISALPALISAAFSTDVTLAFTAALNCWSAATAPAVLPAVSAAVASASSAFRLATTAESTNGRGFEAAEPFAWAFVSGALRITFASDVAAPAA